MNETAISWTNKTWNPTHGCSKISDGCKHCYAMKLSLDRGWTRKPWTQQYERENVLRKPHKLHEPYTLKVPQRIFVNSMSDLFHRAIPDWYRAVIWCVMLDNPHHIFQILTKRSKSPANWPERFTEAIHTREFSEFAATAHRKVAQAMRRYGQSETDVWAPHIWMGVSVEDSRVIHRIYDLAQCRAAIKFVSAEPLLGPWPAQVDLSAINWLIVGGESGRHMTRDNGRWMDQAWARHIRNLCADQHVAFFYKQDSGHRTELRPYLVEEDGSHTIIQEYPDLKTISETTQLPLL
jgi:protein gp37